MCDIHLMVGGSKKREVMHTIKCNFIVSRIDTCQALDIVVSRSVWLDKRVLGPVSSLYNRHFNLKYGKYHHCKSNDRKGQPERETSTPGIPIISGRAKKGELQYTN